MKLRKVVFILVMGWLVQELMLSASATGELAVGEGRTGQKLGANCVTMFYSFLDDLRLISDFVYHISFIN